MNLISIFLALSIITALVKTQQLNFAQERQISDGINHLKEEDYKKKQLLAVDYPQNKEKGPIAQHQEPNHSDQNTRKDAGPHLQGKNVDANKKDDQQTGSQLNKISRIKHGRQKVGGLAKQNKGKIQSEKNSQTNQLPKQMMGSNQNEKPSTFQKNMQHINQQQDQSDIDKQITQNNTLLNEPIAEYQENILKEQSNVDQQSPKKDLKEKSIIKDMKRPTQIKKKQNNMKLQNKQNEFINQNFDQTKRIHKSYRSNIARLRRILNIQPDTEDKDSNIIQTYQDLKEKKQNSLKRHNNSINNIRKEQFIQNSRPKKTEDNIFYCLLAALSFFIALPLIKLLAKSPKIEPIEAISSKEEEDSTELTQVEMHEIPQ